MSYIVWNNTLFLFQTYFSHVQIYDIIIIIILLFGNYSDTSHILIYLWWNIDKISIIRNFEIV